MSNMRIAVFIKNTTFHTGFGGFETQNKVLCEGLVSRGHSVVVFSPKRDLEKEKAQENGVNYVFVPSIFRRFSALSSGNKKSWINKSVEVFADFHKKEPFNLIISQSSGGLGVIKEKKNLVFLLFRFHMAVR